MINNLFLSVGAMKAGTTWLYEILKDHPDVKFTPEKEIHYFANKVGIENQLNFRNRILKLKDILQKYHNGNAKYISENLDEIAWYVKYANKSIIDNEWYISLFDDLPESKYFADFSNLYCQMDHAGWANVEKISINNKVIYTLRDPLKRLWSHYKFHHKWVGKEDDVLDDGIELFKETLNKDWFINNADYAKNLMLLRESIHKDNLMVLYFEDFRDDPQQQANDIADFLNISSINIDSEVASKKVNATKDYKMPVEWEEYALELLRPLIGSMKEQKIWHEKWNDYES
ncbi:sulfotransferase domain-containing protein [Cobetia sp. MC34]|uniref:sulfotransferase domain-containing protein n=1 Tax=Cobetia sp. MC34 TaxID=2785080 RepID=UPI001BC9DC46|nr:sulfotransferase domain-containing protein [Cobetia sp. MC34]MBS4154781.1 sulfotransferase domain-containing protein [Cobetia sp. MC34]